jgi:hypothetical protein
MHKDFHLYGTYLAARLAGFETDDARDVACAAQAVGDFTYGEYGAYAGNGAGTVRGEATDMLQTLWTVFHFLPAFDSEDRELSVEEQEQQCKTAPRGVFFECLPADLRAAFKKRELAGFKLAKAGVTMHVLADAYAHEGFSGLVSKTNVVTKVAANRDGAKGLDLGAFIGASRVPAWAGRIKDRAKLGHGSAGHVPDISWLAYGFTQDGVQKRRSNPEVFTRAFGKMTGVLGFAKNGKPRADVSALTQGMLSRIEDEQAAKIREYGAMWFWTSRIAREERDTVFRHFMEADYFSLQDGYTPGNLDEDYKTYLNSVTDAVKACKAGHMNRGEHYFLNALDWHREKVMAKMGQVFPHFPSLAIHGV